MSKPLLIAAGVCFAIGAVIAWTGNVGKVNWTCAGLSFVVFAKVRGEW